MQRRHVLQILIAGVLACGIAFGRDAKAAPAFTIFDVPGATGTFPLSINGTRTIAGYFQDSGNANHGFVRAADGTITAFDPPGSTSTFASSW